VRIERTSKSPSAPAPAAGARVSAAPAAGSPSFSSTANDAALALQIEESVTGGAGGGKARDEKAALESIDDIAARNSLNIVQRRQPKAGGGQP
jgi:hypothetical protein